MLKKIRLLFFMLCCLQSAHSAPQIPGTVTLLNDSPYILTATVYTQSGDYLGQVTLQPGEQKNFTSNFSPSNLNRPGMSDVSITPYRIVWACAGGGGVYSTCHDGSAGALIRANSCPGPLYCSPKEEKQKPGAKISGSKSDKK